jgi:hypothetical protein
MAIRKASEVVLEILDADDGVDKTPEDSNKVLTADRLAIVGRLKTLMVDRFMQHNPDAVAIWRRLESEIQEAAK